MAINIDRWGYCPYCLSQKSDREMVLIEYLDDEEKLFYKEHFDSPTDTLSLIQWLDKMRFMKRVDFTVNQYRHAFIPIAIINGTPVCQMHMWQQTERR